MGALDAYTAANYGITAGITAVPLSLDKRTLSEFNKKKIPIRKGT